jgi:hypothetical protein
MVEAHLGDLLEDRSEPCAATTRNTRVVDVDSQFLEIFDIVQIIDPTNVTVAPQDDCTLRIDVADKSSFQRRNAPAWAV